MEAPRKGDYCDQCGRLMTLVAEPEDGTPGQEVVVLIQGEVICCCGNFDDDGHHTQARCVDCCGPHETLYQDSGAGYYITSPR